MTQEEAEKVAFLMSDADGGCRYCAQQLMQGLAGEFPEHREVIAQVFLAVHGGDLEVDPL
jgi:hypothetical protein